MSKRVPTNVAASVRQRLLNLSKEKGEDFTLTLVRYAAERFLYRLSASAHAEHFILKGALLLATRVNRPYRPSSDLRWAGRAACRAPDRRQPERRARGSGLG